MVIAKVRRSGNSLVVTIPADEVERYDLTEGQLVTLEVRPVEVRPALAPDLQEIADEILSDERHLAALRYLADR